MQQIGEITDGQQRPELQQDTWAATAAKERNSTTDGGMRRTPHARNTTAPEDAITPEQQITTAPFKTRHGSRHKDIG